MKHVAVIALGLLLAISPLGPHASAQEAEDDGGSMMQDGIELFLDGLRREMPPAVGNLRDMAEQMGPAMRSFLQEMGPAFAELLDEVKDWSSYHAPELLPNGDILIRKKAKTPDAPPAPKQDTPVPPASPEITDI